MMSSPRHSGGYADSLREFGPPQEFSGPHGGFDWLATFSAFGHMLPIYFYISCCEIDSGTDSFACFFISIIVSIPDSEFFNMTETIPGPKGLPLIGNLLDMWEDRGIPLRGLERMAEAYGPIYQASLGGQRRVICSSTALLEELTDEKRFVKIPPKQLSEGTRPKGLFSARNEDPDWGQAHRILMPAFAPLSIQEMFADMKDIANQLILSWARKGPENRILATDDFTRLTLDTIALCTMSYRFNSFYSDTMHPFVEAMLVVFKENTARATRPQIMTKFMFASNARFAEAQETMRNIGRGIIENRRANPTEKKDMLNTMIYGKDPKTGLVMRDDLITEEMLTFLIAGKDSFQIVF